MASKPNADTTKMSPEEVSKLNLHGAKRPPGQSPGGVLHQSGGSHSFITAGRYPVVLAGVLVIAGLGSWAYFRSTHPEKGGQAHGHSPAVQSAAKEDSPRLTENNQARMSTKAG